LKPRLVYGENVRQALQYIQTGDAQAGIVALSVADVPEVSYTLIDDSLHQPLRQSLAVLRRTAQEQLARDFIAFVNGPQGRPIMKKYGFLLPGES
jgi:molybdate transport system substrate-binding protein